MDRREVLEQAINCVCKERHDRYGSPESNFGLIAEFWNYYLGFSDRIKPYDVAVMMALLKIARISTGAGDADNFIDLAGYAACGGELWDRNKYTYPEKKIEDLHNSINERIKEINNKGFSDPVPADNSFEYHGTTANGEKF